MGMPKMKNLGLALDLDFLSFGEEEKLNEVEMLRSRRLIEIEEFKKKRRAKEVKRKDKIDYTVTVHGTRINMDMTGGESPKKRGRKPKEPKMAVNEMAATMKELGMELTPEQQKALELLTAKKSRKPRAKKSEKS